VGGPFEGPSSSRPLCGRYLTPLRGVSVDADSGAILFAFPTDREIVGLGRLLTMRRTARFLRESESFHLGNIRHRRSSAEVLRYKPERRAVVRLDLVLRGSGDALETRPLAARVLPPGKVTTVAERRETVFSRSGAPPAPKLRGIEARPGILFEDWLDLEEMPETVPCDANAAGELLGRLHAVGGVPAVGVITADRRALTSLFEINTKLTELTKGLGLPPALHSHCWIHGDFHRKQIGTVRARGSRVLLDLDELRPGHPIEDLASWLADAIALDPSAHAGDLHESLLSAYEQHGGRSIATDHLASWTSFELLKRAAGSIRRLELGAVERAEALLEAAHVSQEDR